MKPVLQRILAKEQRGSLSITIKDFLVAAKKPRSVSDTRRKVFPLDKRGLKLSIGRQL